jgi:hypothetical protein
MKTKVRISLAIAILMALLLTSIAFAQYTGYSWVTAYQVVNTGDVPADITISYFDTSGDEVVAARKTFNDVPAGASQLVVQFTDDPNLPSGRYSVVISADQPVAAITNQQLIADGSTSYTPTTPFSTYSGTDVGSTSVTLPAVMYNWYNYFTEIFIMNIGAGDATDVDIEYIPGELSGEPTGASGVTDDDNAIPQYASLHKSQETMTSLGAPSGTFAGRFLGSAIITSDEPIIAVVNQHNPSDYKLMTYNGFSDTAGATAVSVPNYMRNYFGYYTTLLVANPSDTVSATVQLTYTPAETAPGQDYNVCDPAPCAPVTATHVIPPGGSVTRYDGATASDAQSDLDDDPNFVTFFGPVAISSDQPVVAQINIEAVATGPAQAGSYNGIPSASATGDVVVPVILADFYGYYTTLIVQNATGTAGSCDVTYTSDTVYSSNPGASKTYTHPLPANGAFTVYEGRAGGVENGDINADSFWESGGNRYFIGAAVIDCDVNVVAFVNEEADIAGQDSMYTMNTFNK